MNKDLNIIKEIETFNELDLNAIVGGMSMDLDSCKNYDCNGYHCTGKTCDCYSCGNYTCTDDSCDELSCSGFECTFKEIN